MKATLIVTLGSVIFALASNLAYSEKDGPNQTGQSNQQSMNRRHILELPVQPEDPRAKILDRKRNGNLETITFEYQGKVYQEERAYGPGPKDRLDDKGKKRLEHLEKKLGLSERDAFQIVVAIGAANGQFRALKHAEKMPKDVKERFLTMHGLKLKQTVSDILKSEDPALVEKALKADGDNVPVFPVKDFVVRKSFTEEPTISADVLNN